MKDTELIELIKRHTKVQDEALGLHSEILGELDNRGLLNGENVISCLHNTEPLCWEEDMIRLIEERK